MKINRRKIVLLMAFLICTILSAQTKGEYISTHFKRGDSIQYVYKLSVKTTNPTTGKPIDFPDDIYENLACSSVWSYYLLNEIKDSYESRFTLIVRNVTPQTYTMRLLVQQSPYRGKDHDKSDLVFAQFAEEFLKEHGLLITFNADMTNSMLTNPKDLISDFIDYVYAHKGENQLTTDMFAGVSKEEVKKDISNPENINPFISLIINLSTPGLSIIPNIYAREYNLGIHHNELEDNQRLQDSTSNVTKDETGNTKAIFTLTSSRGQSSQSKLKNKSNPLNIKETISFTPEGCLTEYTRDVTSRQPQSLIISHESLVRE